MEMNKIRIGLLVDDLVVPYWAYKMCENINTNDFAEVVLVVKKKGSNTRKTLYTRFKNNFYSINYELYKSLENSFFKSRPDAFENKDLRPIIKTTDILEVACIEKKFSDYIHDEDIEKIKTYKIDVFIRLGFRILRGSILKTARFGVWSYHHGDNFVNRGGPAGFWEVFQRDRQIGSILQILNENLDGGEVLYRSWSTVHRFLNQSLNGYYLKTSLLFQGN